MNNNNAGVIVCPSCHRMLTVQVTMTEKKNSKPKETTEQDIGELLDKIDPQSLNPWEQTFVADQRKRYEQYGPKTRVSDKQMHTLRKLAGLENSF